MDNYGQREVATGCVGNDQRWVQSRVILVHEDGIHTNATVTVTVNVREDYNDVCEKDAGDAHLGLDSMDNTEMTGALDDWICCNRDGYEKQQWWTANEPMHSID